MTVSLNEAVKPYSTLYSRTSSAAAVLQTSVQRVVAMTEAYKTTENALPLIHGGHRPFIAAAAVCAFYVNSYGSH